MARIKEAEMRLGGSVLLQMPTLERGMHICHSTATGTAEEEAKDGHYRIWYQVWCRPEAELPPGFQDSGTAESAVTSRYQ